MSLKKRVRIIKKIQEGGNWKFVSLKRAGSRFIWDDRPGVYYLEWWEGSRRCREAAIRIQGVDVLDGTPLLDIELYVPRFDCLTGVRAGRLDSTISDQTVAGGCFEERHR